MAARSPSKRPIRRSRAVSSRATNPRPANPDPAGPDVKQAQQALDVEREQLHTQLEDLRQTQLLLEESRDRYATLYDLQPVGYVTLDRVGVIRQINAYCANLLGLERTALLNRPFRSHVRLKDMPTFDNYLHRAQAARATATLQLKRPPQQTWSAQLLSVPMYDTDLNDNVILTVITDITEQKQIEAEREHLLQEVQAGRGQLKYLTQQLLQAQEAERRRLALELHDEIGQALTGLNLTLDLCLRLPPEVVKTKLLEAKDIVTQLIALEENMSLDLRPSMLDDLGLLPALLWHCDRYMRQTSIQVHLNHNLPSGQRFGLAVETTAYRIVQEALTNVARHAQVKEASVTLHTENHLLTLAIQDHGVGFNPTPEALRLGAAGLSGMQERVSLLDGRLHIESHPGGGTTLLAELPWAEENT